MAKKQCEVCDNPLFSKNNICLDCKRWGAMLKALHANSIRPSDIADHVYERLVHKIENSDIYYEDEFSYELDTDFIDIIQPFTFWGDHNEKR